MCTHLNALLDRLFLQEEAPRAVRKHHEDNMYLHSQLMADHVRRESK